MSDDEDPPTYDPDELLAELRSWETVAGQMNRKLLRIMDVLDEMEKSETAEIREYAERINRLIGQSRG